MEDILIPMLKQDFKSFLTKSFYTLHHDEEFLDNWHLDLMSHYLQAVERREIRRLIINIPPRSLKSVCVSVAWPAWLLARNSTHKIISASYSQALSTKHGIDCKKIVTSDWYKKYFVNTQIMRGENSKRKFVTTHNGFRLSTSIGGTLTGEGADFLIVDDPLTPLQALSPVFLERANTWFEQTLSSRLNDKRNGAIVVVMQRLHVNDLTGFLLSNGKEKWHLLNIPLIAEKPEEIRLGSFYYHRNAGEYLHKARDGAFEVNNLKKALGDYAFAAQYQQNPVPPEGGIIQKQWLRFYQNLEDFEAIYQSWDCAIKTSKNHDYSVCTTWGVWSGKYYLIDVLKERLDYPSLKKTIVKAAEGYKPMAIIVEDKASGQQIIQELHGIGLNVIKQNPKLDKVTRLTLVSHIFESGRVWLPQNARWLDDFVREITLFPNAEHDDQVDASTQFLSWVENRKKKEVEYAIRRL